MGFGGNQRKSLLVFITLALGLAVVLPFQNCGVDQAATTSTTGLYRSVDDNGNPIDSNCIAYAVDCGPQPSFLQISIDMKNPMQLSSYVTSLTVSGRCNTGNYNEHYIHWTVSSATGDLVSQRNEPSVCIKGRYQFNINVASVAANVSHTIRVEMIGLQDGQSISNVQAGGAAESDFSKSTAMIGYCPVDHPAPNWGMRDNQCTPSCALLGGTSGFNDVCSNHEMIDMGIAYDVPFCCAAATE